MQLTYHMPSIINKVISVLLSGVLFFGDISSAIETRPIIIPQQNDKLSPVSGFSEEDLEAVSKAMQRLGLATGSGSTLEQREYTAFLYANSLIARILTRYGGNVEADLLKELIQKHIGDQYDSEKFKWGKLERNNAGVYRLPVESEQGQPVKALYYFLPGAGTRGLMEMSGKVGKYDVRVFAEKGKKVSDSEELKEGQVVLFIRRNRETGNYISAVELVVRKVLDAADGKEVILQKGGYLSDTAVNAVHSYFGDRGEKLFVQDEIFMLGDPKPAKKKERRGKKKGKGFDPSGNSLPAYADLGIDKNLKADFTAGEISKMIDLAVKGDIAAIRAMHVTTGDNSFGELIRISFIKLSERIAKLPDGEKATVGGILRSPHNTALTINSLSIETASRGIFRKRMGMFGRMLGRASARYFDKKNKKVSIVLDMRFVKALLSGGYRDIAAEILAERLAHELAHDNELREEYRENNEETRVIIYVDIPLFKAIRDNAPLRSSIERFRQNKRLSLTMYHSGRYFRKLEEWSGIPGYKGLFKIVHAYIKSVSTGPWEGKGYPVPVAVRMAGGIYEPGSIVDYFNLILSNESINSPDSGISLGEIASRVGADQADIKRAMAFLVRTLKIVMSDTGHLSRDARYYIPESVRIKRNLLIALLSAKGLSEVKQKISHEEGLEISRLVSFVSLHYHDPDLRVPDNRAPITPGILVAGMKDVLGNMDELRTVLSNGLEPYSDRAGKSKNRTGNNGYTSERSPGSVILSMVGKNRDFIDTGAFSALIRRGGIGFVIDPAYVSLQENGFYAAGRHLSPGSYYRPCYQGPHGFIYNSMIYRRGKGFNVPFDAVMSERAIPRGAIKKLVLNRLSRSAETRSTFNEELGAVRKILAEEFPLEGIQIIDEFGWIWYEQSAFSHDTVSSKEKIIDGLIGLVNDEGFRTNMGIANQGMDENELRRALDMLGPLDGADILFAGEGVTVMPLLALLKGAKKVTIADAEDSINARWGVMIDLFRDDLRKVGIELSPKNIRVCKMNMIREGVPYGKYTHVVCLNVFNPIPNTMRELDRGSVPFNKMGSAVMG
ncbi:MAG: hypothetical protein HQL30_06490, partial [Candidatus Omnitrophica bacterium]|nr:hypothetical protein [Candidatus Omnitrophota bacterium]